MVADAQMMIVDAVLTGSLGSLDERQTGPNTINQELVDWAKGTDPLPNGPEYICNGDSMFHVVKGIIVIRVEETRGYSITGNTITDVTSHSVAPFTQCDEFHPLSSKENFKEQQAGNIRGISVAAVRGYDGNGNKKSDIRNNILHNFELSTANVIIGIDAQGDSEEIIIQGK